jgi:hypothetical protein
MQPNFFQKAKANHSFRFPETGYSYPATNEEMEEIRTK